MVEFDFRECPHCGGYGIRDNGRNCVTCGGTGTHGLRSKDGVIGSGEIIVERGTGRMVSRKEFNAEIARRHPTVSAEHE